MNSLIPTSRPALRSSIKEFERLRDLWRARSNEGLARNYETLLARAKAIEKNPVLHADFLDLKNRPKGIICRHCGKFFEHRNDYSKHTIECL